MKRHVSTCAFSKRKNQRLWSNRKSQALSLLAREYLKTNHPRIFARLLIRAEDLVRADQILEAAITEVENA